MNQKDTKTFAGKAKKVQLIKKPFLGNILSDINIAGKYFQIKLFTHQTYMCEVSSKTGPALPVFCSNSIIETAEQCVKPAQS